MRGEEWSRGGMQTHMFSLINAHVQPDLGGALRALAWLGKLAEQEFCLGIPST